MQTANTELVFTAIDALHRQKKTIVFTNGCFDILHVGHVRYLAEARQLGDVLVVGINSDASVRRLKGERRPVNTQEDRREILLALRSVDFVCIFEEDTPLTLITRLRPNILVKGGDWPEDKIIGADLVRSYGGQVKSLKFIEGYSTTAVLEKGKGTLAARGK